jgi:hypothetical protein
MMERDCFKREDLSLWKVWEKLLQTAIVFMLVLCGGMVDEAWAEETATSGTCGDNCTWSFSGETLTVIGAIQNYPDGSLTPWNKAGLKDSIKIIDASACTKLGTSSFEDLLYAEKVIMPKRISEFGAEVFRNCQKIESLELPDSLKIIGSQAFSKMDKLKSITIPDSAVFNNSRIFEDSDELTTIYCKGNIAECQSHLNVLGLADSVQVLTAPESQCTGDKYYWSGSSCNNKKNGINCAENWRKMEDWCNRIRYTPAEAAEVLRDGSDNTIIMTFKVNR